ncbi:hypothetical protein QM797_05850 [Rhodococcus sp. IEGM 1381]|uniref:hypothetical protein n=1 Tax=Rhodococcus sp. IEGM 1381 TaxID=3047085 RepID=UPI0024B72C49|nr:hypothetical protein [Rhodococcus sp. IEGM 1381]MDI9894244.1 hypothetical protein [Rhodococcus sp. IEGM 1381]
MVTSDVAMVAAKVARPSGISRWEYLQTVRNSRKLVGVAWGTSSYEGTGASPPSQRIPSRLEDLLQAQTNPAGVAGGYTVLIAVDTSLFTGTAQSSVSSAGFCSQSRNLASGGAITHSAAVTAGFDLYFEAGSGSAITVSIDGGRSRSGDHDSAGRVVLSRTVPAVVVMAIVCAPRVSASTKHGLRLSGDTTAKFMTSQSLRAR